MAHSHRYDYIIIRTKTLERKPWRFPGHLNEADKTDA